MLRRSDWRAPRLDICWPIHEHEFMFIHIKLMAWGVALWAIGTVALRLVGGFVLPPGGGGRTLLLLVATIPVMAWVARGFYERACLPVDQWPAGALALM